ncbi:MAG: aminopeptidase P family protein [Chthonomonas sp.]|nr:aminopeptidase P family protein [Chthonomonas sp.]
MNRTAQISAALQADNVDCVLLSSAPMMGYAHGFFEDGHERLLLLAIRSNGDVALIAPALSANQARRHGIEDVRPWSDGEDCFGLFRKLAEDWELRTAVIAIDPQMRADILLQLQHCVPSAMFQTADRWIAPLMAKKDANEIQRLKAAAKLVEEVYADLLPTLAPGETERELAGRIQAMVLAKGAGLNFCITATGAASAEPHHLPDDTVIKNGDVVLMDFGCVLDHYQADITRVVSIGPASPKVQEVYSAVRDAHNASVNAIHPGATGCEVDNAGRDIIVARGFGPNFNHRTGHGIGIRGHEAPNMSSDNLAPLEPGNTFSIEPGVYLEGEFGIRLENIYACGETEAIAINESQFEDKILEL